MGVLSPFARCASACAASKGGKGGFKIIMLRKSPLALFSLRARSPYGLEAKEGYKSAFVLFEPVTEKV